MKREFAASMGALLLSAGAVAAQPAQPPAPAAVASPTVIMLRLYTTDFAKSERFYEAVFGTKFIQNRGDRAHILIFPRGTGPGIILIKASGSDHRVGSFVVQAPDLADTLARAKANGAVLTDEHFEAPVQGAAAQSGLFTDPDGNLVEVLQIGGARK